MKLAFITDMHLGVEGEKPEGVDVRQNFLKALDFVANMNPNAWYWVETSVTARVTGPFMSG